MSDCGGVCWRCGSAMLGGYTIGGIGGCGGEDLIECSACGLLFSAANHDATPRPRVWAQVTNDGHHIARLVETVNGWKVLA